MSKILLVEHTPFHISDITLLESKNDSNGRMRIRGKLQEAEVKNGNGRVYPKETLLREVEKYEKEQISQNTALGELDHAENTIINLKNVSHNIKRVWWENNDLMGELELLNTPAGKIAQEIVSAGIPLGISSRGMGSVKQMGETVEVQDDFELLCWDLCSIPSTPNAYMRPIREGKEYTQINNSYDKINSLISDIICLSSGVCPLPKCDDKF